METLVAQIYEMLRTRKETLSVAESCTGGGLAEAITSQSGISEVFFGSVTAYANQVKQDVLQVPHDDLVDHGAVSEIVAKHMARNCRVLLKTDWALSTTGIAGPSGGSVDKPVGLVWIGIAGVDFVTATRFVFANCSRREHRERTIGEALNILKRALSPS